MGSIVQRACGVVAVLAVTALATPGNAARSHAPAAVAQDPVVTHAVRMAPPGDPVTPPPANVPVYVSRPVYGTAWPGNMPYYGGPVLLKPRVYIVFWGWPSNDRDGYAKQLVSFFAGIGGSAWAGVATQYYEVDAKGARHYVTNPRNQLAGVWYDKARPPKHVYGEGLIGPEAVRAAQHFHITDLHNSTVLVASPPGRNPTGFVEGQYCAWHSWTDGLSFINLPYLLDTDSGCGSNYVNPGNPLDGVSIVAGHEYLEAVTDPAVSFNAAWHDLTWQENADKCEWIAPSRPGGAVNIKLRTGTFAVQQTWSNVALSGLGDCAAA